ncbi:hypothetical protein [Flagellimonas onchidii]|uniref:hypothetical protein n=1 Tax=Flagellimonas onchidii TaxID=2562684 RepID=UPI0010A67748|nr:hypothetical protein [Allomuricauda onchidii]
MSKAQLKARGNNELIVRSKKTKSQFSNQENLSAKETLKFDGDIKWYKAYDFDDGESLNDIKKINLDGSL